MKFKTIAEAFNYWRLKSIDDMEKRFRGLSMEAFIPLAVEGVADYAQQVAEKLCALCVLEDEEPKKKAEPNIKRGYTFTKSTDEK